MTHTINLPNPITLICKQYYSPKLKVGTKAKIDKIASCYSSNSKLMVRVIDIWKNPVWFDAGYFKQQGEKK